VALAKELLAPLRQSLSPDSPELAGALAQFSLAMLHVSAFADAESLLRECLTIREKAAPDDWRTFNTKSMLGGALLGQAKLLQANDTAAATAKFTEAEPLLARVYEIRRERLPAGDPAIADALEELGLNQFDQGNYERAETYLRDALAMRRASLGDAPHPDVAENLNNLALLLMESSRFEESERLFQEAMAMNSALYGALHPDVAVPEEPRTVLKPFVLLVNKCDDENLDEDFAVCCELLSIDLPRLPVSAINGRGFDTLKELIFEILRIVRVYAKPPGMEPDMQRPFVLKQGDTVQDLACKIHREIGEKLKSARVWGSAEFAGQMVHRDYMLQDGDVVELKM